ncbi:MAG: HAMP domain-containing sensor histidine kinase [Bacillota bacterium]
MRLRTQLTLSILLVAMLSVGLISVLANISVNRRFAAYFTEQGIARSGEIVQDLQSQYDEKTHGWTGDFLHTVGMYSLYDGYLLKVYDAQDKLLWDAEHHDMTLCAEIMDDITARMRQIKSAGGFTSHNFDILRDGEKVGSVSVTYYGPYFYGESEYRFQSALNSVLLSIGAFALVCSVAAGFLLARMISRPIAKTAAIAKEIAQGNYEIRFEGAIKTLELNELVLAINSLAGALSEQERLRKRLTADVAHELRTPLATVGAYIEAMLEGIWEPTPQRLTSCHEEILRLNTLVEDLSCLTRLESELPILTKEPVDLLELAKSVCAAQEIEWSKKKLELRVEGQPSMVEADADRMRQVVTNLLSNAIKYTPEHGHIRVTVTDTPQAGILQVRDDGIGIPQNELELIFERFYRTDQSRARKTGGAGIGLAIVKSIVTAHGGTVRAESGKTGSVFTLTLPKTERQA